MITSTTSDARLRPSYPGLTGSSVGKTIDSPEMVSLPKIQTLSRTMGGAGQTCQVIAGGSLNLWLRKAGSESELPVKCLISQTHLSSSLRARLLNLRTCTAEPVQFLLNSRNPDAQHSTSLLFLTSRMTANRTLRLLHPRHQERRQSAVWSTGPVQIFIRFKGVSQRPTLSWSTAH